MSISGRIADDVFSIDDLIKQIIINIHPKKIIICIYNLYALTKRVSVIE